MLLAAACAGCATEDYGYAREHRFDRPYLGGASNVATERPQPTYAQSSEAETIGALAFFAALAIAIVGHADISCAPPPERPPPPPPPSGH
jgi:hypothetical protein